MPSMGLESYRVHWGEEGGWDVGCGEGEEGGWDVGKRKSSHVNSVMATDVISNSTLAMTVWA